MLEELKRVPEEGVIDGGKECKIERLVLSEAQQTVLVTLYLIGVREVWLEYGRYLHECPSENYDSSKVELLKPNKVYGFDFHELALFKKETFSLEELIINCCPYYQHILESNP